MCCGNAQGEGGLGMAGGVEGGDGGWWWWWEGKDWPENSGEVTEPRQLRQVGAISGLCLCVCVYFLSRG